MGSGQGCDYLTRNNIHEKCRDRATVALVSTRALRTIARRLPGSYRRSRQPRRILRHKHHCERGVMSNSSVAVEPAYVYDIVCLRL